MISVIIPAYNEEQHIQRTIESVLAADKAGLVKEIIVADGGSADDTVRIAGEAGARAVISPHKGRAVQMNWGASIAAENLFYFLHADTTPPEAFSTDILKAIKKGYSAGCFMLAFDHAHWFLNANCWFTRFDVDAFRYGDQSLFVKSSYFKQVGGFCEQHIIFEDYQIIKQLKRLGPFAIIKKNVTTSARKYIENGIFKMQGIFYLMYFLYKLGLNQQQLISIYKRLIRQDKL